MFLHQTLTVEFIFLFQPNGMDNIMLWKGVFELITEPKPRQKLDHVNTLEDVVKMIETSKKIIVLTGAGVRAVNIQFSWSLVEFGL